MGKLEVCPKVPIETKADLGIATHQVLRLFLLPYMKRTRLRINDKENTVAVISDGSAVLGLGNIGPEAAMPSWKEKLHCLNALLGGFDSPCFRYTRYRRNYSNGEIFGSNLWD